jgi:hypothetical protein
MTLTLPELIDRLKQLDEITLLESLGVTSEDLVDRFSDVIEDKQDHLQQLVDWD